MFYRESHLTITESVVKSADSAVESAAPTTDSTADPVKSACGYKNIEKRLFHSIYLFRHCFKNGPKSDPLHSYSINLPTHLPIDDS